MSKVIKLKQEPQPTKVKTSYDERSPLTGNFTVMVEQVTHDDLPAESNLPKNDIYKICMESGYQTYWNSWKENDVEFIQSIESQMPKWLVRYKYVDSYKRVWYPMLAVSYVATLYPFPVSDSQLGWAVATVMPVQNESELEGNHILKLPLQTDDGVKLAYYKIDSENAQHWKFNEFEEAFDVYHSIVAQNSDADDEE